MTPAEAEQYVDAAAAALALPLRADHRPGVLRYFGLAAGFAALVEAVPLAPHVACVEALRAAGGTASLKIYPGVGHDSWTPAYQDPDLLPWLLSQRTT